jgi:outer membrane protein TolC
MKRYLGILIALTMILSLPIGVYGEVNVTPNAIRLDLEQAYKLLEANNLEIKLLDKKIEMKLDQNEDLVEDIEDIQGMYSSNDSTNLQYEKTRQLSYKQATLELDSLYNDKAEKLQALKTSVKQQYISLLSQKENIDYIKQDIEVMDKEMKEIQLRMQLGQAKESEYKSMYAQSLSLQNQLNSLNTQYQTSMINFKILLGVELSQPIEIQNYVLPYVAINRETLQNDMTKAVENDFAIQKLERQIELQNLEIKLVKKYTDAKFSSEYRDLIVELDELETELSYQKISMEADLLIEYYNLQVLDDKVKLAQLNLEIAKINYDATMAKAKLGLVDTVTEINAGISYNRQKNSTQDAMYDYIMAAEEFNRNLNLK